MSLFDFKRGDLVRICRVQYNSKPIQINEDVGIIVMVGNKVLVFQESDQSLIEVSINGQSLDNHQFIQIETKGK